MPQCPNGPTSLLNSVDFPAHLPYLLFVTTIPTLLSLSLSLLKFSHALLSIFINLSLSLSLYYQTTLNHTNMDCCIISKLKTQPFWFIILFALGLLTILRFTLTFLNWLYVNFLRPSKDLKKYGSWALVTGPTDGIGKSFAFQLASKGLNLILVGRNPDKLKDVSDSIQAKFGNTQVKTIVVDFAGDLDEGVQRIRETIEGLDIGVLINNVGISYPYAKFFHEVDEELLKNLIKVNVVGTTKVTQAVLPGMLKRKKGAIVNIGSGAAIVIPSDPLYAVYAATKA